MHSKNSAAIVVNRFWLLDYDQMVIIFAFVF